jgi:hypothetical protein
MSDGKFRSLWSLDFYEMKNMIDCKYVTKIQREFNSDDHGVGTN